MSDIVERLRAKAATAESRVDERTTLAGIDVLDEKARIPMEPAIITLLCRNGREAADEIERLRADIVDVWRTFDAMWNANQRAIKRWHAAGNPETVWPDHADMVVWLLERLSAAEAQRDALVAAAKPFADFVHKTRRHKYSDGWPALVEGLDGAVAVVHWGALRALAAAAGAGADDGGAE